MEKVLFLKKLKQIGFVFVGSSYDERWKFNNYIIEIEQGSYWHRFPKMHFRHPKGGTIFSCYDWQYIEMMREIERQLDGVNA